MYKFNETEMFYDVADGRGIVINYSTGIYYSLNSAGTAVFDQLKAGADPKALAEKLSKISGCPKDIADILDKFAKTLVEKGVLLCDDAPYAAAADFNADAFKDGFEPVADEFHDVQDLILADPIHDVDPNFGWSDSPETK